MEIVFKLLAVSALCAIMPQTLHAEDVKTSLDSRENGELILDTNKGKERPTYEYVIVYDRKTKTFKYILYRDNEKIVELAENDLKV